MSSKRPTLFPVIMASLAVLWTAAGIPFFVAFYKPSPYYTCGEDAVLSQFVRMIPWLTAFSISGAVMTILCLVNALNQGRIAKQYTNTGKLIRRTKAVTCKHTAQVIFFAVGAFFWIIFFAWNLFTLLRLRSSLSLDMIY